MHSFLIDHNCHFSMFGLPPWTLFKSCPSLREVQAYWISSSAFQRCFMPVWCPSVQPCDLPEILPVQILASLSVLTHSWLHYVKDHFSSFRESSFRLLRLVSCVLWLPTLALTWISSFQHWNHLCFRTAILGRQFVTELSNFYCTSQWASL
jgi:hypothetical protein